MIDDLELTYSSPAAGVPSEIIREALREQQSLRTPVALFAEEYDAKSTRDRFTHLIPLSKPNPGEQYAFEVNLDACTGCKACVAACHSLNGLDDDEAWRDVGLLVGLKKLPYLQTVTTACHHCEDPACANGCPVLAYDKDAVTGIVRHLDDQCIGCSYCILKCPYDVPKFNLKRGIVRKCDMCQGRLAEGEAPACVQACPNEAIKIKVVKLADVPRRGQIIAGAFDSSYTRPTTTYVSAKPIPNAAQPADASRLTLDHGHPPLAWMLVLTQMSAGGFLGCALGSPTVLQVTVTLAIGLAGIALSVSHLGQPLKAWRAFLGWRKSWLSREIIAFGALPAGGSAIFMLWDTAWRQHAILGTALAALAAVACSVMVYVDTRRPYWSLANTTAKFFGTTLLLGAGLCAVFGENGAMTLFIALRWLLSIWELSSDRTALEDENCAWHKSARLLHIKLRGQVELRAFLLIATGLFIPTMIAAGAPLSWMMFLALLLAFWSQLIERYYFFTAAAGSKMPGN